MLLLVAALGLADAFAPRCDAPRAPLRLSMSYSPTTKRVGDAATLVGLSIYQQALPSLLSEPSPLAPVTLDLGGACIRGCRLTVCLLVAERIFKLFRAPESTWEVPVPVEAAAVSLLMNLGLEYAVGSLGDGLPRTLAHSLGGSPGDVAAAYLTIITWRIVYTSAFPPPPR